MRQNPAERNFHIFYSLLAGADESTKQSLQLWSPKKYYYLSQSGCVSDPTINDEEDFQRVEVCLRSLPLLCLCGASRFMYFVEVHWRPFVEYILEVGLCVDMLVLVQVFFFGREFLQVSGPEHQQKSCVCCCAFMDTVLLCAFICVHGSMPLSKCTDVQCIVPFHSSVNWPSGHHMKVASQAMACWSNEALFCPQAALTTMKFMPEQQKDVFKLLAAILHLGNVTFLHVGSAQVNDKTIVDYAAQLLNVDSYQLGDCLITRVITVRGEEMSSPLTVEQVCRCCVVH